MKKLIAIMALTSSLGVAYADEPVALTDSQMDNVSAGTASWGSAGSNVGAIAIGPHVGYTDAKSFSKVVRLPHQYKLAVTSGKAVAVAN